MDGLSCGLIMIAEKKIIPLLAAAFPLLEAKQALEWLARDTVQGKIAHTSV
jgi:hypothetical protein